ncbi:MAG: hypothetical protein L3J54_03170 [Draconibacterium sp.]|nr:hypothetical protein [Draconibacterium sp.]
MQTIKLRVNDRIYKNILWLLGKFDKEELQIIEEDTQYISAKDYLGKELQKLIKGEEKLLDIDEVNSELENTIKQYED